MDDILFINHKHTGYDGSRKIPTRYIVGIVLTGTEPATAANYGFLPFIAPFPVEVLSISEVHGTAGTDAGAVNLQVERLQGTEALGAGDTLLATAFNLKATANTVVRKETTALAWASGSARRALTLSTNDRLALRLSGTPTAVANLVTCVELLEI